MKALGKIFVGLVYTVLYAPLAVMVLFSFNSSDSTTIFTSSIISKCRTGNVIIPTDYKYSTTRCKSLVIFKFTSNNLTVITF